MAYPAVTVAAGVVLSFVAASFFGYPFAIAIGWGAFVGALASLALRTGHARATRLFYGAVAIVVSSLALWVFATHAPAR
jgi:hypothetical protein